MYNSSNLATGRAAVAITPHDSTLLATQPRAIYVGGAGNVTVVNPDGTTCLFSNVPQGAILPVECKRINATGTTATLLVGLL